MTFLTVEKCKADSSNIYVDVEYLYDTGDGSVDHPYRSIQKAINHASEGDSIFVFEGRYNETIVINKQLSLVGLDRNNTFLQRKGYSHRKLIEINADYVTIENFTISDEEHYNLVSLIYVNSNYTTIQGNRINASYSWGIFFDHSTDNTIGNNIINNTRGIYLRYSDNNVFSNNNFTRCAGESLSFDSSSNNIIYNNSFNRSKIGISIKSGSDNNNVSTNTINNSDIDAIKITSGNNNIVEDNYINNSDVNGICQDSSDCIIAGNILLNNQIGINLGGDNNQIRNNYINDSRSQGIYARPSSDNNIIFLNRFNDNQVNAKDSGNNIWYSENQGNYWDDYKEVDRDLDNIGDVIYSKEGVQDLYPLGYFLKPPNKPTNPLPLDEADNVGLVVTLSINISDSDSDFLDVYFYRASDDKLYGTDYNVVNNSNATCTFNLAFETIFLWYAIANDGRLESQSDIFIFTTQDIPPSNEQPVADPGGPYTSLIGEEVTFDASGSNDYDGTIVFYRWSFGDGDRQILATNPVHNYSDPGTYIVTLTVVDNDGRSCTETTTVTVFPSVFSNDVPTAVFDVSSSNDASLLYSFDASNSSDLDGIITNYTWDFGDGIFGYGSTVMHNYSENGTYEVSLVVTDDFGDSEMTSTTITVGFSSSSSEETQDFKMDYSTLILIAIVIVACISAGVFFWRWRRE